MYSNIFNCCNQSNQNVFEDFRTLIDIPTFHVDETNLETQINGHIYHKNIIIEEIDFVVRVIRRNWCFLQNAVLSEETVVHEELIHAREEITKCLWLIVQCIKNCDGEALKVRYINSTIKYIKTFTPLILPLSELQDSIYLKLSCSSFIKKECPVYQYFHTFLDVHYHLLLLDHVCGNSVEFKDHVNNIIMNLIFLSEKCYQYNVKSSFICNCNKNFWLIIQLLCERILDDDDFWLIFNKVVENHGDKKYILWLLQDVADLQAINQNGRYVGSLSDRIKPNFGFLESSLQAILLQTDNNSSLKTLKSLESLVCDLWLKHGKIEIYQILWDYFSKRLNISSRSNTNLTMTQLVELIDTILWAPKECQEDFELFLAMFSSHLNEHPHHWSKMKGRIFSQLGPNKVNNLNNAGLFHVLLLFISLTKVNFEDLAKKFVNFIETVPTDKKQSQLIWNFYASLIVRHIRENRSIEAVAPPFIKMLEDASNDHKLFFLIKTFVTDFDNIIKVSTNLQLHQWLLINTWLHKYMLTCYHSDLVALLKVLLAIIERVSNEEVWCDWEPSVKNYVYPSLKHVSSSLSAPEICGTLAAKIAVSSTSLLSEAFNFFNNDSIVPKVSSNFLCVLLENSFITTQHQETVALQSWVKTCLLTRENYDDLTRNIVKLDILPPFIKDEISTAGDPLCAFIECMSVNIHQHVQSVKMNKLCEICFGVAERWIAQYFNQPDNEAVVLRIYTCMALAFYKIGPLLYNRHKNNCPYARLINVLLLSREIMTGKPVNAYILQSIKKTWHLFFEATVKLNSPNDTFIDRTLRELVIKYVPQFAIVDSPMLKCLDNEPVADVILDKMSAAFFRQPIREAESSIFKSLRIIHDFVQSTTSLTLLKLVINKALYGLFEVVMSHSQRNTALTTIKAITTSPLYPQVKREFEEILLNLTGKHLAFNALNYFQLMGLLAKFIPNDLKGLMPRIRQQISNVEQMRGVGFDKNLRLNLERLEATLLQLS